jgi:pimeloyl-ACP methyl ester carboxylesterase
MATMGLGRASLADTLGGAVAVTCGLTHPSRIERLCSIGALVPGFPYRASWAYQARAPLCSAKRWPLGHARLCAASCAGASTA